MLHQQRTDNNGYKTDVIVVGGGLAGLTAAAYLARAGQSVKLFEKSKQLGGRAITRSDGAFRFNMGPHALYRQGNAAAILNELGVPFTGEQAATEDNFAWRNDRLHTLPIDPATFLSTGLLGLRDKLEMLRLFMRLPSIETSNLAELTVQQWLETNIRRPRVRQLMRAFIRVATYTNAPQLQSAGSALAQLQLGLKGVWYLDEGWQVLVEGLRRLARSAGAGIITGARVSTIERDEQGTVRAVRLADGSRYAASTVIVAAEPGIVEKLVQRAERTILADWAEQAIPVKAATLEIGLKRLPRPKNRYVVGIDRPLYFSVHSAYARLAPAGGAMIHVAKYLEPNAGTDPQRTEAELEALVDQLQPGWRSELAARQYLPNITVTNALVTAAQGGRPGRPGPDVPGIPGLYVVGDWVGNEGLLSDAALASAKQAAELILTDGSRNATLAKRSASAREKMSDRQAVVEAEAL